MAVVASLAVVLAGPAAPARAEMPLPKADKLLKWTLWLLRDFGVELGADLTAAEINGLVDGSVAAIGEAKDEILGVYRGIQLANVQFELLYVTEEAYQMEYSGDRQFSYGERAMNLGRRASVQMHESGATIQDIDTYGYAMIVGRQTALVAYVARRPNPSPILVPARNFKADLEYLVDKLESNTTCSGNTGPGDPFERYYTCTAFDGTRLWVEQRCKQNYPGTQACAVHEHRIVTNDQSGEWTEGEMPADHAIKRMSLANTVYPAAREALLGVTALISELESP